jgi:transposase-like protein
VSNPTAAWSAARRKLVEAVRAGRLSQAEAARELGVSSSTVRDWVRSEEAAARFVAVDVRDDAPQPAPAIEVVLAGGRVVRVPPGSDADEVARLVRALEASC